MSLRLLFTLVGISLSFASCLQGREIKDTVSKSPDAESRVVLFNYGGYSDTVCALIYGRVYEKKVTDLANDSLFPLSGTEILVEQNNKKVITDSAGEFEIELEKGAFSLVISKQGYEPLRLTNYISDPDQISTTKIILAKGQDQRTFRIPDWKE